MHNSHACTNLFQKCLQLASSLITILLTPSLLTGGEMTRGHTPFIRSLVNSSLQAIKSHFIGSSEKVWILDRGKTIAILYSKNSFLKFCDTYTFEFGYTLRIRFTVNICFLFILVKRDNNYPISVDSSSMW